MEVNGMGHFYISSVAQAVISICIQQSPYDLPKNLAHLSIVVGAKLHVQTGSFFVIIHKL